MSRLLTFFNVVHAFPDVQLSPAVNKFVLLPPMKFARSLLFLAALASAAGSEPNDSAAVLRADERRIRATVARDADALRELLSDDLHYAHADGRVQTKDQLVAALSSADLKYVSVQPEGVQFHSVAPGAATLSGRTRLVVDSAGQRVAFTLRFLSVWREESGQWRLIAYQSSQLPAPVAK